MQAFITRFVNIFILANLVSAHAAFLIKHNMIASGLASINQHWDDERIFQVMVAAFNSSTSAENSLLTSEKFEFNCIYSMSQNTGIYAVSAAIIIAIIIIITTIK